MPEGERRPAFVDAAFVERALRLGGDGGALVRSVAFDPVGAAGDHYASTMFRATVKTEKGTKTLIVKTLPPGEIMKEAMREQGYFRLETFMFTQVIPRLEELLGGTQRLSSRCTYHGEDPEDFLVIEDLAPAGFRLADRKRGLDLNHALLALRTLARFHAASAALLARDPALRDVLKSPFREDDPKVDMMRAFLTNSYQLAADAMRTYAEFPQELIEIAEVYTEDIVRRTVNVHEPKENGLNVIAHGDFWVNNMMFRYEKEELVDIRLVDFQLSHVGSPAIDILYFLSTSVSMAVFRTRIDLLLRQYLTALNGALERLGLDAYPAAELHADLRAAGFQVSAGAFMVLPVVKADKAADFNKALSEGKDASSGMYATATYEQWLRCLLPEFHRRGWFV